MMLLTLVASGHKSYQIQHPAMEHLPLLSHSCESPSLYVVRRAKALALTLSSGGHHQANDEAIESESFCENEDQNHADKQAWLLGIGSHAGIADDANRQACCEGAHAHCKACTQVCIA